MKKPDVYMYLHCDEWNSCESMNPCQDNIIYSGRHGRQALWRAIMNDVTDGIIEVYGDIEEIKSNIMHGDPTEANDNLVSAYIIELKEAK